MHRRIALKHIRAPSQHHQVQSLSLTSLISQWTVGTSTGTTVNASTVMTHNQSNVNQVRSKHHNHRHQHHRDHQHSNNNNNRHDANNGHHQNNTNNSTPHHSKMHLTMATAIGAIALYVALSERAYLRSILSPSSSSSSLSSSSVLEAEEPQHSSSLTHPHHTSQHRIKQLEQQLDKQPLSPPDSAPSSPSSLLQQQSQQGGSLVVNADANSNNSDNSSSNEKQWPEYTRAQVAEHKNAKNRIWVTYKDGVYDITDFVAVHPGGDRILLAAGSAIDPFWKLYAVHDTADTKELLAEYRIGTLKAGEYNEAQENGGDEAADKSARKKKRSTKKKHADKRRRRKVIYVDVDDDDEDDEDDEDEDDENGGDPYRNEPDRVPVLKVNTQKAFNAETPPSILIDEFITPNDIFFVRNHLPVPIIDPKRYELHITGIGVKDVKLTVEDLKTLFIHHSVITTMQCAGNRRAEMSAAKPVKGIEWTSGAIGTAEWTGVRLSDVLQYAGLDPEKCENNPKIKHVQFEGLDRDMTQTHYGGSIPIEKAIDRYGDVILAFQMNGTEIPRDHGYPIRVIVPGHVGARNVKWLGKIVVSSEESKSFWQQHDYKGLPPTTDIALLDPKKAASIQELPVQSSICEPRDESAVNEDDGRVEVKGYAWSGGGRDIIRVDITADNGYNWQVAELKKPIEQRPGRAWAWTPFRASVKIPENHTGSMRVCSKAVDASYNVQPEHVESIWNPRGFLNNVWSCINLKVEKPVEDEDEDEHDEE